MREGLAKRGIAVSTAHLEKLFAAMDANADARVSATEFDAFCEERRGAIRRAFVSVDRDENGEVDSEELRCGVERAGLKISDAQLRDVFEKLDKDKSGTLSEKEFEEALMLLPKGANPAAVFDAFLRASFVDDAESHCSACKDLPPRGGGSLAWAVAMKMASGGVAGAVSRTATAPIDRVKTILQTGRVPRRRRRRRAAAAKLPRARAAALRGRRRRAGPPRRRRRRRRRVGASRRLRRRPRGDTNRHNSDG